MFAFLLRFIILYLDAPKHNYGNSDIKSAPLAHADPFDQKH